MDTQDFAFENVTFSDVNFQKEFNFEESLSIVKAFSATWDNDLDHLSITKQKRDSNNSQLPIIRTFSPPLAVRHTTDPFSRTGCSLTMKNLMFWGLPKDIVNKYEAKGITSMFDWQVECLSNEKVLNSSSNLIYSAPTSAGKTLVAEILCVKTVLERKKKVIVILPFVSVVREKMFYFQDIFSESGIRVEGFMGSHTPPGGIDAIHVAICTIEKANNLVNKLLETNKISELGAIVVDELHLLGDPHRGYILELLLTKLLYITKKHDSIKIQIIGMSATLPNLSLLSDWLEAVLYKTDFRPIPLKEYCLMSNILYDSKFNEIQPVKSFKELNNDKDFIVGLCLETILECCSVLIFCPTKNWCENLAQQIANMFKDIGYTNSDLGNELRKQIDGNVINETLEQLKHTQVGLDEILGATISFGVAFHHAGLTIDERDIVENGFKSGAIRVLVATSTLSSGVNLPARRVIIRSPMFNTKPLSISTYKQMVGRAGRTGIDSIGESILVCSIKDKNTSYDLMNKALDPVSSCLEGEDKLMRAVLEAIASEIVTTTKDVQLYINCTLFSNSNDTSVSFVNNCLTKLESCELIRCHTKDGKAHCSATPLGKACLSSSMSPQDGITLFTELQKARECFVLETDLHMIYLVTPYSICNQWGEIDWFLFLNLWDNLSLPMKRVGKLVGIEENFIYKCMRGNGRLNAPLMIKKYHTYKRFYTALALQDLVNEIPLNMVASKFNCSRGMLQSLQQSAATFAGMVTAFTRQLGWKSFELLVSQFQDRLYFGIQSELLDLMKLQSLNGLRARALFNVGFESISHLANADVCAVENALTMAIPFESEKGRDGEHKYDVNQRNIMKNIWITGKKGITANRAAELLVVEARRYLELEMGVEKVVWKSVNDVEESKLENHSITDDEINKFNINANNQSNNISMEISDSGIIKSDLPSSTPTIRINSTDSHLESTDSGNVTTESFADNSLLDNVCEAAAVESAQRSSKERHSLFSNTTNKSDSIFKSDHSSSSIVFDESLIVDTQLCEILDNKPNDDHKKSQSVQEISNNVPSMVENLYNVTSKSGKIENNSHIFKSKRKQSSECFQSDADKECNEIICSPLKIRRINFNKEITKTPIKDMCKCSFNLAVLNKNNIKSHIKIICVDSYQNFEYFRGKLEAQREFSIYIDTLKVLGANNKTKIGHNLFKTRENSYKFNNSLNGDIILKSMSVYLGCDEIFHINLQNNHEFSVVLHNSLHLIKQILQDRGKKVILYDSKIAFLILYKYCDITIDCLWEDVLVADWLLASDESIKSLGKMANLYCSFDIDAILSKSLHKNNNNFYKWEMCLKAFSIFHVMDSIKNKLRNQHAEMIQSLDIEMKIVKILSSCESSGIRVNKEKLVATLNQIKFVQRALETNAYKYTGRRFRFSSSSEVAKVIGIYNGRKVSTNKRKLEKIDNSLAKIVIFWRKLNNILTKNIFPLISKVSNESIDERIYGTYWTFTSTGRMTMQEPNLQSIPRDFDVPLELIVKEQVDENNISLCSKNSYFCCRDAFLSDENNFLISADYRQLELRLLAQMCEDDLLRKAVTSDRDIFKAIASEWKSIGYEEIDDDLRQKAKQMCYGVIYGMGIKSLAQTLDVSEIEADVFMRTFHATYPGIKLFINSTVEKCMKSGYIETLNGRRRYLPSISSSKFSERAHAERQAVNTRIQGSAADILKTVMISIETEIKTHSDELLDVKLVLILHDELIYEVPVQKLDRFASIFKHCMEKTVSLSLPLSVKMKYGKSWGKMEELFI